MPVGLYVTRQEKLVTRHRSRENHYLEYVSKLVGLYVYGTPTQTFTVTRI
jgi:hypothetical protein